MRPPQRIKELEQFRVYEPAVLPLQAAAHREAGAVETLSNREIKVSLVCGLIAAAIMIETLFFKFTGAPESVYIFKKMGTEPWMRWGQGFWELSASLGLLIPRLRWAGGVLTTGAMSAAILSHMTWLGYSVQGDHGLLFSMALVTFTCGLTVTVIHRHKIPGYVPTNNW